jgi:hypothetical protein
MPELGYAPVNTYLPPRPRQDEPGCTGAPATLEPGEDMAIANPLLRWLDRLLSR